MSLTFQRAVDRAQIEEARTLFREYQKLLGIDLCFQGFDEELRTLPEPYHEPDGVLLLAFIDGVLAGCAGIKPLSSDVCELKRLYVRPAFRGHGIGRELCQALIREAEERDYSRMRLDTLERLGSAVRLYRELGFVEVEPYYDNPLDERVIYMERALSG